jgi:hypothetical protein
MDRRRFLGAAAVALCGAVAGCQTGPDSSEETATDEPTSAGTPTPTPGGSAGLTEAEVEACARTYIDENVVDVESERESVTVRTAESPSPRVVGVGRQNGHPVYEVRAFWGISYYGYAVTARAVDEAPPDAPRAQDLPLDAVDGLRSAIREAIESGESAQVEVLSPGTDEVEALQALFGERLEGTSVVVDREGSPVELALAREQGLHADYEERAYYHAVDGAVYRTEEPSVDPTEGKRIEC